MRARVAIAATLLTAVGCSGNSRSGGARTASGQYGGPVITEDELATTSALTALDAVKRLRPNFLTARGASPLNLAEGGIAIYAEGVRLGGVSSLNDIFVQDVHEILYLNATEATQRFGTGHANGAILVTRK
jgi:hypothetical protein